MAILRKINHLENIGKTQDDFFARLRPTLPPVARLPKPRRDFVVTAEVLKAAGVSFPTLRDWIKKGIIPPPLGAARGRGNLAKYPRQAVLQADLARRLRAEGWSLDEIAEHMKTHTWEPEP